MDFMFDVDVDVDVDGMSSFLRSHAVYWNIGCGYRI